MAIPKKSMIFICTYERRRNIVIFLEDRMDQNYQSLNNSIPA